MGCLVVRFGAWFAAIILLLSQSSFHRVNCQTTQGYYYQLIDDLFTGYKSTVRPTSDDSTTKVLLAFWLLSIQNLDEKNQVLKTTAVLAIRWTDDYLTWNPGTNGNITSLRMPQKDLWLPDIVIENSVQSQSQLGYNESPLSIFSDGTVNWFPSEILETSCDMDVTYYPFDTQVCKIIVSTWVSTIKDIDLDLDPNRTGIVMDRYSPSGTWELVDSKLTSLPDENGNSRLEYSFTLKRLSTYYILNIIMPILILSLTASGVFFLPADAGEKIGMSMTILLAYAVYLTIISDQMPQTSLQISILSVYLTMLLGITALSVVWSVYILHLHHTPEDQKVGKKTTAVTRKLRNWLHLAPTPTNEDEIKSIKRSNSDTGVIRDLSKYRNGKVTPGDVSNNGIQIKIQPCEEDQNKDDDDEEEKITWQIVSATADYALFLANTFFILLVTLVVMLILNIGGRWQS